MTSQVSAKQDLRIRAQNYIYTCTSDPTFVKFLHNNQTKIRNYLMSNNLIQKRGHENLSQKDMLKINVDRYVHAFKLSKLQNQPDMIYRKADYFFNLMGITLNTAAFLNTIELLGDQKQAEYWRKQVLTGRAFGGYGQTQLGHGSNVQGLETQAHYDEKRKLFVLKSPTVTSAKYWPGVLGLVCTHSVIQVKTFVKGKSIGIQTFVFEARDENLQLLNGVKAGDIGSKFGFHRVDNGYLSIDNVQVPRQNMLMKYVQVTPEGEVIGLDNKQAIKYAYGSMLYLRVALPFNFSLGHMIYPARQLYFLYEKMGKQNQAEYKKEIINYTATGVGYILANRYSQKLFQAFSSELNAKNFEKADKALVKSHIISATFKALASWKALKISTEIATRNKYTIFRTTGLPYSYNNIVPSVTYEGDNSVLLQQTARFILMKDKGEDLSKPNLKVKDDDLSSVINMLRYVSSMEIRRLKKAFQVQFEAGTGMKNMWNQKYQRDIIEVSKLWGTLQLLQGFADTLKETADLRVYFTKVGKVFTKNLLVDVPQIYTYGFEILQCQPWNDFTEEEFWALTHLDRPISVPPQQHQLMERQGSWLRSRL